MEILTPEINDSLGWVKLPRNIKNEVFYNDSHYVHVWIHILTSVNHKKGFCDFKEILPGQCFISRKSISESTGIDESKIQRILKYLEEIGYIEQQMNNHGRVVTLLSWNEQYKNEQPVNSQCTASEQPVNTNNNNKNDNNDNNKETISVVKKKFKNPTLEEVIEYCKTRNNTIEPEYFIDYYTARDWMIGKNKMKDWRAAVRTWERNTKKEPGDINQNKGMRYS